MNSYQQCKDSNTGNITNQVTRASDFAQIPFDPANRDYVQFKLDLAAGAVLQDPMGKALSATQVQSLLTTLNSYRQVKDSTGNINTNVIQRVCDGAIIPNNSFTTAWQDYLRWLLAGNTPLPPQ